MKKILNIFGSFKPEDGGPTTMMKHFLYVEKNFSTKNFILTDNINDFFPIKNFYYYKSIIQNYHFSLNLIKILYEKIRNFDHIIVHGTRNFYLLVTYFVARNCGKKINIFLHGSLYPLKNKCNILKRFYFNIIDKKILISKYTKILVTSVKERKLVADFLKIKSNISKKILIVKLGISLNYKGLKSINRKKYFLYIGRFNKIKNLDYLCEEFSEFSNANNCILLMVGPFNSYSKYLKNKYSLKKNIIFKNFVTGREKKNIISSARALVISSLSENFSYSIVEALSLGVPIILNRQLDLSSLITKNKCGMLFDLKKNSLKKKLFLFLNLSKKSNFIMRKNAKKLFKDNFDIYKNYGEFIKKLD